MGKPVGFNVVAAKSLVTDIGFPDGLFENFIADDAANSRLYISNYDGELKRVPYSLTSPTNLTALVATAEVMGLAFDVAGNKLITMQDQGTTGMNRYAVTGGAIVDGIEISTGGRGIFYDEATEAIYALSNDGNQNGRSEVYTFVSPGWNATPPPTDPDDTVQLLPQNFEGSIEFGFHGIARLNGCWILGDTKILDNDPVPGRFWVAENLTDTFTPIDVSGITSAAGGLCAASNGSLFVTTATGGIYELQPVYNTPRKVSIGLSLGL